MEEKRADSVRKAVHGSCNNEENSKFAINLIDYDHYGNDNQPEFFCSLKIFFFIDLKI